MILALATRHRVERPAISMGGGEMAYGVDMLSTVRLASENECEIPRLYCKIVRTLSKNASHRETQY